MRSRVADEVTRPEVVAAMQRRRRRKWPWLLLALALLIAAGAYAYVRNQPPKYPDYHSTDYQEGRVRGYSWFGGLGGLSVARDPSGVIVPPEADIQNRLEQFCDGGSRDYRDGCLVSIALGLADNHDGIRYPSGHLSDVTLCQVESRPVIGHVGTGLKEYGYCAEAPPDAAGDGIVFLLYERPSPMQTLYRTCGLGEPAAELVLPRTDRFRIIGGALIALIGPNSGPVETAVFAVGAQGYCYAGDGEKALLDQVQLWRWTDL